MSKLELRIYNVYIYDVCMYIYMYTYQNVNQKASHRSKMEDDIGKQEELVQMGKEIREGCRKQGSKGKEVFKKMEEEMEIELL